MNTLLILGNGFDLAHGRKTSYSDFFLWYLNNIINELAIKGNYEDELIKIDRFPKDKATQKLTTISDFKIVFDYSVACILKNPFSNLLFKKLDDSSWVDIEYIYFLSLKSEYERFFENPNQHTRKHEEQLKKCKSSILSINQSLSLLGSMLEKYLTMIQSNECEILPDLVHHLSNELVDNNIEIKGVIDLDSNKHMALNFNYTDTFKNYLNCFHNKSIILNNIHGVLNDSKNPIIFGYGDEMNSFYSKIEDLNLNTFLNNFKSFSYLKTSNYKKLLSFMQDGNFKVIILGHSCGLPDRVLLNSIFENENCLSIKIYYYKIDDYTNDYYDKIQEISRHFKNKSVMRSKIISFDDSISFPQAITN